MHRIPAALLAGALAALAACRGPEIALPPVAPAPARPEPAPVKAEPATLTPAQIAARATPAVVSIRSATGLGTGFVVRKEGWIATNLHVVAGADALVVATPDGREFPVIDVLAADEVRDLAILRVEASSLPTLALGDSDAVRAGDGVVAIGHPLGLEDTVSNGLVSAVRVLDPALTVLQISAPIAPGSSGGPLFGDHGEVIGVATAFINQGQNLNFGVPVKYLKALLGETHPVPLAIFAAATAAHERGRELPKVHREVPTHDPKLLTGCNDGDLQGTVRAIEGAIDVGAPLYNQGNFAACYHIYEGAALDVERRLPGRCTGPKRALGAGRTRAATLADPSAQAWAMRDAFDGLLDVIARRSAARRAP